MLILPFVYKPYGDVFNGLYWATTVSWLVLGVINLVVKEGIKYSTYIARILLGALFVVSGLIKANDTLGFSFKLEEYFAEDALGWTIFEPHALWLSILIAGSEIVLGLAVIFGGLIRISSWALMGMILFFAWLTYFTASCNDTQRATLEFASYVDAGDDYLVSGNYEDGALEYDKALVIYDNEHINQRVEALEQIKANQYEVGKDSVLYYMKGEERVNILALESFDKKCVTDCGCFGDALKGSIGRSLTPWESFFKDLALLVYVIIIFLMQGQIKFNDDKDDVIILSGTVLFTLVVGAWLFGWWFPTIFVIIVSAIYMLIKKMMAEKLHVILTAALAIVFSFGFALYTYTYLPIKDYRGYALGNNLIEKKNDGVNQVNNNLYTYKHNETGELLEIFQDDYMQRWEEIEASYSFVSSEEIVVVEGKIASIQDFTPSKPFNTLSEEQKQVPILAKYIDSLYQDYYEQMVVVEDLKYGYIDTMYAMDYDPAFYPDSLYLMKGQFERKIGTSEMDVEFTEYLFSLEQVLLVISYDIEKSDKEAWKEVAEITNEAMQQGIPVFCIASADHKTAQEFAEKQGVNAPFLSADGTELKIVVRSNPGMIYLKNAVVTGKWDYNRFPTVEEIKAL